MEPEQPKDQDQQNYWQPQDEAGSPQTAAKQPAKKASNPATKPAQQPAPLPAKEPVVPENNKTIVWEASDAVDHARGPLWFIGFVVAAIAAVAAASYFQQWVFAVLLVVASVAVIVIARRPARVVEYELTHSGLSIDDELHPLSEFRTFGVIRDGAVFAVKLIPVKRFSPEIMVYFSEEDGEEIVDLLGAHLPMEEMKLDLADKIIRKIRL